jgi:hypothetical protein
MSEAVIIGLISGAFGVAIATIPAYLATRRQPSPLTTNAIALVDANGEVISNLTDEIARLEGKAMKAEERATLLERRIGKLEAALRRAGIDPLSIR